MENPFEIETKSHIKSDRLIQKKSSFELRKLFLWVTLLFFIGFVIGVGFYLIGKNPEYWKALQSARKAPFGHQLQSVIDKDNALEIKLKYYNRDNNYLNNSLSPYFIDTIFQANYENEDELTISFNGSGLPLTDKFPFPGNLQRNSTKNSTKPSTYKLEQANNSKFPFKFAIKRVETNETIFNTSNNSMIFSEKYNEITTEFPFKQYQGIGEKKGPLKTWECNFTIWTHPSYADTANNYKHGIQPFWLVREQLSNYYHLVFQKNYMQTEIRTENSRLKIISIGGKVELKFIFCKKSPETCIGKQIKYINCDQFYMPNLAGFGLQIRFSGNNNSTQITEVLNNSFVNNNIPVDSITLGSSILQQQANGLLEIANLFKNTNEIQQFLKKSKINFIIGLGPGIPYENAQQPQIRGNKSKTFLQSAVKKGQWLINCDSGLPMAQIDQNHPNTTKQLFNEIFELSKSINLDGIELERNEITTEMNGEITSENNYSCLKHPINISQTQWTSNFPYLPRDLIAKQGILEQNTISLNASHYNENDSLYINLKSNEINELQFHSWNNLLQTKLYSDYLKEQTNDYLLFSQATIPGSGIFAGHIIEEDKMITWENLLQTISSVMNFNLNGINFVGVSFSSWCNQSTENNELWIRSLQLQSLLPVFRIEWVNQCEKIGNLKSVEIMRTILNFRQRFLRYQWTSYLYASCFGLPFIRPLFFEFPGEYSQIANENSCFFIGESFIGCPALEPKKTSVEIQLPRNNLWFELNITNPSARAYFSNDSVKLNIEAQLTSHSPLLIRAGRIVFFQNASNFKGTYELMNLQQKMTLALQFEEKTNKFISEGIAIIRNAKTTPAKSNCIDNFGKFTAIATIDSNQRLNLDVKLEGNIDSDFIIDEMHVLVLLPNQTANKLVKLINPPFNWKENQTFSLIY